MRILSASAAAALVLAIASPAKSQVVQLDFEGIVSATGQTTAIDNFYSALGVEFLGNALAICSRFEVNGIPPLADCEGNFLNNPAPGSSIMIFLDAPQTGFNFAAGFDTGFSFFYGSPFDAGSLQIFDGLDGTGNLLASLDLAPTPNPDDCPTFGCRFDAAGVAFAGTAQSVIFSGVANRIAFDNITFGSANPNIVPEPSTYALMAVGLAGLGGVARRRRRRDNAQS